MTMEDACYKIHEQVCDLYGRLTRSRQESRAIVEEMDQAGEALRIEDYRRLKEAWSRLADEYLAQVNESAVNKVGL